VKHFHPAAIARDASVPARQIRARRIKRVRPTEEELLQVVQWAAKMRIYKNYHGRPPRGWDWADLNQEIIQRTLNKMKDFRHGGPKTLKEYAAMAAYHSLIDVCREHSVKREDPRVFPLLEEETA
jgi:DNA-directed RNA polymerase specialized sigma24 family protein